MAHTGNEEQWSDGLSNEGQWTVGLNNDEQWLSSFGVSDAVARYARLVLQTVNNAYRLLTKTKVYRLITKKDGLI
jgi:hypothetical protein